LKLRPVLRKYSCAWQKITSGVGKRDHRFFRSQIPPSRLGWSPKNSRRILGHYDSSHGTIIVTRKLDSPPVPRYLAEHVVYHEMLHIRFPAERRGQRRVVHSQEFRKAEKKFPKYE